MRFNVTLQNITFFLISTIVITLLIKLFYYLRIKKGKNVGEFIIDIFYYANKMVLHNLTVDDDRMRYLKIKNYCVLVFWSCLLILLILFAKGA